MYHFIKVFIIFPVVIKGNNDLGYVELNMDTNCDDNSIYVNLTSEIKNKAIPFISGAGLIGNGVAILSIQNFDVKCSFHQSLNSLCICDIIFLVVLWIDQATPVVLNFPVIFPLFWHPLRSILVSVETHLMMSISMERYLAVMWPLEFKGSIFNQNKKIYFGKASKKKVQNFGHCPKFSVPPTPPQKFGHP